VPAELITRSEVRKEDTWDLSGLFADDDAWEQAFEGYRAAIPELARHKGTLGESASQLSAVLADKFQFERQQDRLAEYAQLTLAGDVGNFVAQDRMARLTSAAAKAEAELAYFEPEVIGIADSVMRGFLEDPGLADYRIYLSKLLRMKQYILGEAEERIMSLQAEPAQTAEKAYSALLNSDLEFGTLDTDDGPRPLTQSSLVSFLQKPDAELRERAYTQFYGVLDNHKQVLAALLGGSVQQDVFHARVRGFESARAAALYPDKVPEAVYDNLISTVRSNLPALHRFYALRARALGIPRLKHSDAYVPLVSDLKVEHSYDEAVKVIMPALAPLGDEYCSTLEKGLKGRWVDRYENKGKRSGAFSAGMYDSIPFILMNYESDNIRDVFTLAHEAGHSMHSWYAKGHNPYPHYNYTIFEAEVASTFNEQLLVDHLLRTTEDGPLRTYLVANQVQDMVGTIFRQTMFAEFEKLTHDAIEAGEALTVDSMRSIYRGLLEAYFGPDVDLQELSSLEFTRIPHFYWAFYVYKYATGLSAAITLSQMVLQGGATERDRYLAFLKAGGSMYPLESLKTAGVDMASPEAVGAAMERFTKLVNDLETMI
jgi:oligoendopeptidase F